MYIEQYLDCFNKCIYIVIYVLCYSNNSISEKQRMNLYLSLNKKVLPSGFHVIFLTWKSGVDGKSIMCMLSRLYI